MEGEGGEKDEEKDAKKRRLSAMMKIIEKIETDDIKWQHRGMEDLINTGVKEEIYNVFQSESMIEVTKKNVKMREISERGLERMCGFERISKKPSEKMSF